MEAKIEVAKKIKMMVIALNPEKCLKGKNRIEKLKP
jgi:hypothetical protein